MAIASTVPTDTRQAPQSEEADFCGMVGQSRAMLEIYAQIARVAATDSTVVILGESGTGKELVAQALHLRSARHAGTLVAVNTTAIPESLMESELFGHVKGAFTGSVDRIGCFQAANGGTLFIDEIGDLQLTSQAKLLRVLESRRVTPIGSTVDRPVDVRVVAATNRCLEELVSAGKFRSDLYYRLNVVTIHLPPLRARRSDIPVLVEHFLEKLCEANRRPMLRPDGELMDFLENYYWPGNVRQLKNCLESMVVMASGPRLTKADLPLRIFRMQDWTCKEFTIPVGITLEELEKRAILTALDRFNGNRSRAAQSLGISVRTLQRKLKSWSQVDCQQRDMKVAL